MKVDCALLCDAATVREGLLHVLGGGVSRLGRPSMPAPLGAQLALRILVHPTEARDRHTGRIVIQTQDGGRVSDLGFDFGLGQQAPPNLQPGEELALPLVVPINNFPIPAYGSYSIEILIDGTHQMSLPFVVHPIDSPPQIEGSP